MRKKTTITENENVITGLFINVFRAIEIAKAGGFSVTVIYVYENGASDYNLIKNYCKGWFDNWSDNGDIYVELYEVKELGSMGFESKEIMDANINSAKKNTKFSIDAASYSLLNAAQKSFDLSLTQLDTVNKIALVIAKVDKSEETKPEHFCEALNYQHKYQYVKKGYIIAETEQTNIVFGYDNIQIKVAIKPYDYAIKEAIDYLTSLLSKP